MVGRKQRRIHHVVVVLSVRACTMRKRVAIVDPQEAVRELLYHFLGRLPEYEVVGQAGAGLDAMPLFEKKTPNLAIIELFLPQLSGLEVLSRVRRKLPEMRVVVFTDTSDTSVLRKALQAGPDGIVHKSEPLEILLLALRMVSAGGRFFSPRLNHSVDHSGFGPAQVLSTREIEVMQSIAEGKSNKEIAVLLGISTKTVDNHRSRLMQKLRIHNAASLTLAAVKMGILPLDRVELPASLFEDSVGREESGSWSRRRSRDPALRTKGDKELARLTTGKFSLSHQVSVAGIDRADAKFFDLVP
jgi:DNA-binding NarL/FixJ family response regulator